MPVRAPFVALLILAVLLLGASGCTRSASTPVAAATSPEGTPSGLAGQQATMDAVRSVLLTQTAQADTAFPTAVVFVNTPTATEVVAPTATPDLVVEVSPTPAPTEDAVRRYVVQPGDWIWKIARDFGVSPDDIIAANNLQFPYFIYPGDVLIIPTPSP
jgi:LysM repeat protein